MKTDSHLIYFFFRNVFYLISHIRTAVFNLDDSRIERWRNFFHMRERFSNKKKSRKVSSNISWRAFVFYFILLWKENNCSNVWEKLCMFLDLNFVVVVESFNFFYGCNVTVWLLFFFTQKIDSKLFFSGSWNESHSKASLISISSLLIYFSF